MICILCNKNKDGIKKYNGNPLCDDCLDIQKKLLKDFSKRKKYFHPECDEIIKEKLYLGNYDFALNKDLLKNQNISCIIVCGSELECKFPNEYKYLKINLNDYIEDSILPYIDQCLKFIDDNKDKKIFIHCNAGVSRSPSIVIAYLIKGLKYSFKEAYDLVKSKRKIIKPNDKFMDELQTLK
jgi:protein-tyrosine phosphatase